MGHLNVGLILHLTQKCLKSALIAPMNLFDYVKMALLKWFMHGTAITLSPTLPLHTHKHTDTQTHTHTHTHTQHTHTHTLTLTHSHTYTFTHTHNTHSHTQTHTHTHTHTQIGVELANSELFCLSTTFHANKTKRILECSDSKCKAKKCSNYFIPHPSNCPLTFFPPCPSLVIEF